MIFFRKKKALLQNIGTHLRCDLHAHWLPGIDDGAKDMEETLAMLRRYEDLGYRELVATPHIMAGVHENEPEGIVAQLVKVREAAAAAGVDLRLSAAAEYMIDEAFAGHMDRGLMCVKDDKVLVEQSYVRQFPAFKEMLYEMQLRNYVPVLAHPERYFYWHRHKLKVYEQLAGKGVLLQLNLLSLVGYYGKEVRKVAEAILEAGLYSCAGTDAHSPAHLDALARGVPIGEEVLATFTLGAP